MFLNGKELKIFTHEYERKYWVGKKIHLGVFLRYYRKTQMNFLVNPIWVRGWGSCKEFGLLTGKGSHSSSMASASWLSARWERVRDGLGSGGNSEGFTCSMQSWASVRANGLTGATAAPPWLKCLQVWGVMYLSVQVIRRTRGLGDGVTAAMLTKDRPSAFFPTMATMTKITFLLSLTRVTRTHLEICWSGCLERAYLKRSFYLEGPEGRLVFSTQEHEILCSMQWDLCDFETFK